MEILVKPPEAAKHFGVSISTLRRWARNGLVKFEVTEGGHYRYFITKEVSYNTPENDISEFIIYGRVSSKKQEQDLHRQIKFIRKQFPEYSIITDIGSGINYKRKGFQTILERLFKGNIKEVVVAYPDRFSRFGFDLFQWIFNKFGAKLTNIGAESVSEESEFFSDIMEIITVFTARYYGRRKYGNREDQILP